MRGLLLSAAVLAGACSAEPRQAFPVGLLGPVSPRVAEAARGLGVATAESAPAGAATIAAAATRKGGVEVVPDWADLRLLGARAACGGAAGVYFRLPTVPAGRDILDYPEEWQAVARVARELVLMRPVLEGGERAPLPFPLPSGLESRSWIFERRPYVLLVNASPAPVMLEAGSLEAWRALFAVRSDPRQALTSCGAAPCLQPGGVLWLEGRVFALAGRLDTDGGTPHP